MKEHGKNHLGMYRLYANGRSTVGYIRGDKVENRSDVTAGDLLIGVDHKHQREYLVEVIPSVNLSLLHYKLVYTKILKRAGLVVREVKNVEYQAVLVTELGIKEFWHAEQRLQVAA